MRRAGHASALVAFVGIAAAGGACLAIWPAEPGLPGEPPAATASGSWGDPALGVVEPAGLAGAARPGAPLGQDLLRHLTERGSLRGTDPDGAWPVDAQGRLVPAKAVRWRFEYYLGALGELRPEEIEQVVAHTVRRELPDAAAAEVMDLWRRYLGLRQAEAATAAPSQEPWALRQALGQLQGLRRQWLGPAWAQAFYADEERLLQAEIERREQGAALPDDHPALVAAPGSDPALLRAQRLARYGAEATARLEALDHQWADWRGRLAAVRERLQALQADPALSQAQRQDEARRLIEATFHPGERERARALLSLQ